MNFWFNLNSDKLGAIGVYHPFPGRILGLHVRDSLDKLKATLGEPSETSQAGRNLFYTRPGWPSEARFVIDSDGKIEGILVYAR